MVVSQPAGQYSCSWQLKAFGWALLHDSNFFNWNGKNVLVGYPAIPDRYHGIGYWLARYTPPALA
jgi:hypothetical protein